MKKQLLLGSAVLAAMCAYPQNGRLPNNVTVENYASRIAKRISTDMLAEQNAGNPVMSAQGSSSNEGNELNLKPSNTSSFTTTWNAFSGSFNIYGCALSGSALLNYNEEINAVTFVHRKSTTYVVSPTPSPAAESGGVIAMVSQNWGANWDSTCVYANDNHLGRYPQGGVYNPSGNVCIENAFIVATGPVNTPPPTQNWVGNFYASKPLGPVGAAANDSMVSTVPNAVQVLLHSNTGNEKTEFTRYDFTATDDGKVRAMGIILNDITGATNPVRGFRGARLMTGAFNAGSFVWTSDSIIPQTTLSPSDNTKESFETPHMAWNESGTVGYIFHIGVAANATLANRSYQPIIYKTVNSGATWAPANGINFNDQSMNAVFAKVPGTRMDPNVVAPFFDENEGIAAVVDKDDNLHIVALVKGSVSVHPDSMGFTYLFPNVDQQNYGYGHVPGLRPVLFDFYGDGSAASWSVAVVDSLTSEAPSGLSSSTARGFAEYPWSVTETGNKQISDARIQASRTADGNYIVYTFAESDSSLTQNGTKWNEVPNVKARMMDVTTHSINPTKINITRPQTGSNLNVASRAYFHYASRKCAVAQSTPVGPNGPCIVLPITVSRNSTYDPTTSITHRYASAALNFGGIAGADMLLPGLSTQASTCTTVGIYENSANSASSSFVYPNPAKNTAVLSLNLYNNSAVNIVVSNMVGQVVKSISAQGVVGENNLDINVSGLVKGIYMVTVKIDGATSTKKLIVE